MKQLTFTGLLLLCALVAPMTAASATESVEIDLTFEPAALDLTWADDPLLNPDLPIEVALGLEEPFLIGELDMTQSRRRCDCKDQCFSDFFCSLFSPGKVCRAVGTCGCKKCVAP